MTTTSVRYGISEKWRPELLLASLYIVVFGGLLIKSGFLPYVMDANESFSAFWHARNLYEHGLARSFGLADESFAYHQAAHPYVHTHQGNFPRVFAFLIYVLGARTIESQILVTTFTAGLASILFAYRYFLAISNRLLAAIVVLVLMTDYILVSQWQVVTYRVWHMFFVFSTLLCVHGISGRQWRLWASLTVVNYVCLFYYELIFAAFVALFAGLYTVWLYKDNARALIFAWVCQVAGAALGLAILTIQLILYLGWDGFLQDAYLTFVARNEFRDSGELLVSIRTFYESRNIAFWYNLEDGSRFRKIGFFAASLLYYEFQVHTPYFFMACTILAVAYVLGYWMPQYQTAYHLERQVSPVRNALTVMLSFPVITSAGMVSLYVLRRWMRDDMDTLHVATLIAVPLVLFSAMMATAQWQRLFTRTEKAWPSVPWTSLGANVVGICILVFAMPSMLPRTGAQTWLVEGHFVFGVFWFLYWTLLGYLAATFLWARKAAGEHDNRGGKLLSRGIAGIFLYLSLSLLWMVCLKDNLYLGITPAFPFLPATDLSEWVLLIATVTLSYFIVINVTGERRSERRFVLFPRAEAVEALGRFSLFVTFSSAFIAIAWRLFYQKYAILWREIAEHSLLPAPVLQSMLLVAVLFGGFVVSLGARKIFGRGETTACKNIVAFLLIGFISYAIVYVLSPGYIFSGYRFRLVPFSIFHTELLVALPIYVMASYLWAFWPTLRSDMHSSGRREGSAVAASNGGIWGIHGNVVWRACWGAVAALLAGLGTYWLTMQATYVRLLPPDHFSVLKELSSEPYKGASFAVGNYAAPVAAYTGRWAYYDPSLVEGRYVEEGSLRRLIIDDTYRWFADRRVNAEYDQPQYFICLVIQTLPSVISRLGQDRGLPPEYGGCSTQELVKMAQENRRDVYPRPQLMAIDTEGPKRVGFDSWAIIKFDWSNPPRTPER